MEISDVDQLIEGLDPVAFVGGNFSEAREDVVWASVLRKVESAKPFSRRRRPLVGAATLLTATAAAVIALSLWPSTTEPSSASEYLISAANLDSAAANLPPLPAGQYYYQSTFVTQECGFSGPSSASDPSPQWIKYITTGTIQSWIGSNGQGQVVSQPNPTGVDGSNFATPQDEATWIAAGKPFNACDTVNSGSLTEGGSVTGYGGFGFFFNTSATQQVTNGTNVASLPSDVSTLGQMLAQGEINSNGTTSAVPQVCPIEIALPFSDTPPGTVPQQGQTGCSLTQEITLIVELLQNPDASAKFGSVLYQLLSTMPGATRSGMGQSKLGASGNVIVVPDGSYDLTVIIDTSTGALLECSVTSTETASSVVTVPTDISASYGAITVVAGIGSTSAGG